jgi:hypothetical protein
MFMNYISLLSSITTQYCAGNGKNKLSQESINTEVSVNKNKALLKKITIFKANLKLLSAIFKNHKKLLSPLKN